MRQRDADAYAAAGVDTAAPDARRRRWSRSCGRSTRAARGGRSSAPGHYASVLALDDRTGIALCTDGVGTKLIVAEQAGRFDTVGIDCVAMNVNDLICVGAEPLAMVDYIAVEQADPDVLRSDRARASRRAPSGPASRSRAASSRSFPR